MKLKDFATINMGQSPKGETYNTNGNGMPFLQGRKTFGRIYPTIDTWTTNPIKTANKDEILMSVRAPVGDMNIANQNVCIGRGLCSINANNGRNKYLYYMLLNSMNDLKQKSTGTVFDSINRSDLENLEIDFHSEDEQIKIENILGSIDSKIELNNEINNNLYEFTNKLFEEKILNNQDKEHWTEYVLSDISKMINGYSYKGNELTDKSDIGMATIKNFERTGGFKLDGFKDIIPEKVKDDHYVKPYEVLVACTDLTQNADIIGNAIMLLNTSDYNEIIMSMDLVKLVPITDFINNYMLYAIVNSKDFKDFALGYKSGTTVLHLNKNCFKEYTIKLPNEDILKDLSKVIEVNYKKISQIIEENKKLEQLRDTLLSKLMNGDIDLDNIEI